MGAIGDFLRAPMTGCIGRAAFWRGFLLHFALSIALLAIGLGLTRIWPNFLPLLFVVPIRAILLMPQISLYVRRLHDAGRSGKWLLLLMPLYAAGLLVFVRESLHALHYYHEYLRANALINPEGAGNMRAIWEVDLVSAVIAGSGALTGLPGPIQLVVALIVGLLKPKPERLTSSIT